MNDEPLTPFYYIQQEDCQPLDTETITIQAYLKGILTSELQNYFRQSTSITPSENTLYLRQSRMLMTIAAQDIDMEHL